MHILGIDIGGTGIKGALVDVEQGQLASERHRILTPHPATPEAVAGAVAELVAHFRWQGPVGCGVPGVVRRGVLFTAANLDPSFSGVHAGALFQSRTGCPFHLLNDADAAGLAEMRFGAGRGQTGTVLIVTLGTGIGTALFVDGRLVPNTELGHIEIKGHDAERKAAGSAKEREHLTWKRYARRVDRYLRRIHAYLWPDLIILGGGVSAKADKFVPLLTVPVKVVPATLQNEAGIVGAALAAVPAGAHVPAGGC